MSAETDADRDLPAIELDDVPAAPPPPRLPVGWFVTTVIALLLAALSLFAAVHETQASNTADVQRSAAQQDLARVQSSLTTTQARVAGAQALLAQQKTRAGVIRAATERASRAGTAATTAVDALTQLVSEAISARLANDINWYNQVASKQRAQEGATASAVLEFGRAADALELLAGDTSTIA